MGVSLDENLGARPVIFVILGGLLLAAGGVLDLPFRFRMYRIGQKGTVLQGGAFNQSLPQNPCGARLGGVARVPDVGCVSVRNRDVDGWVLTLFRYKSDARQIRGGL
jgi:hypothetical protein